MILTIKHLHNYLAKGKKKKKKESNTIFPIKLNVDGGSFFLLLLWNDDDGKESHS